MSDFFQWYYHEIPRLMLRAGRGYMRHAWYGLSVPTLARTLFAPWKRDYQDTENLGLVSRLQAGLQNLLSRCIGLIIRLGTIFTAGAIVIFEVLFYAAAFLLWLGLPFIVVILLGLAVAQIGVR